jgi:FKBP-type peptidyl-prolyl cis-trans isomerase
MNNLRRTIFSASTKPNLTQTLYRSFHSTAINMGVTKEIITPGNGADKPKAGDNVTMVYTGWLQTDGGKGDQFDSSVGRGDGTFPVKIGTGQVIKGTKRL